MKKLLAIFVMALLAVNVSVAQNNIRNLTGSKSLTDITKNGLQELGITDVTVTIVDLQSHYNAVKSKANAKPWGVTIAANKRTFTIVISTRHEHEVGLSFEERIAHELIHLKQSYNGNKPSEKQAYKMQYQLAQQIK